MLPSRDPLAPPGPPWPISRPPWGPWWWGGAVRKEEVPSLGTAGATSLPSPREYIVWKEKVKLFLELTQCTHAYAVSKLLLKMAGRVAEYVLLTFPAPLRVREDAVWALFDKLDKVILGDVALMVQRGVKQLTSYHRGTTKMEVFLSEFQLKAEFVQGLGKHIDSDVLGTILLDKANVSDTDRKLILTSTQRSVDYMTVLNAMRLHFLSEDAKGDVYEAVGGGETLKRYMQDTKWVTTDRENTPLEHSLGHQICIVLIVTSRDTKLGIVKSRKCSQSVQWNMVIA